MLPPNFHASPDSNRGSIRRAGLPKNHALIPSSTKHQGHCTHSALCPSISAQRRPRSLLAGLWEKICFPLDVCWRKPSGRSMEVFPGSLPQTWCWQQEWDSSVCKEMSSTSQLPDKEAWGGGGVGWLLGSSSGCWLTLPLSLGASSLDRWRLYDSCFAFIYNIP